MRMPLCTSMASVDIKLSLSISKMVGRDCLILVAWVDQNFTIPTFMTAQLYSLRPSATSPLPSQVPELQPPADFIIPRAILAQQLLTTLTLSLLSVNLALGISLP